MARVSGARKRLIEAKSPALLLRSCVWGDNHPPSLSELWQDRMERVKGPRIAIAIDPTKSGNLTVGIGRSHRTLVVVDSGESLP